MTILLDLRCRGSYEMRPWYKGPRQVDDPHQCPVPEEVAPPTITAYPTRATFKYTSLFNMVPKAVMLHSINVATVKISEFERNCITQLMLNMLIFYYEHA